MKSIKLKSVKGSIKAIIIGLSLVVSLPAFSQTSKRSKFDIQWIGEQKIANDPSVLLMSISDGVERKGEVAVGSGRGVRNEFRSSLIDENVKVIPSSNVDLDAAFIEAKNLGLRYVMKIEILTWENNATQWDGKPDVAEIMVSLYSVETKKLVVHASHKERSKKFVMGSYSPDKLVPIITKNVVDMIFD